LWVDVLDVEEDGGGCRRTKCGRAKRDPSLGTNLDDDTESHLRARKKKIHSVNNECIMAVASPGPPALKNSWTVGLAKKKGKKKPANPNPEANHVRLIGIASSGARSRTVRRKRVGAEPSRGDLDPWRGGKATKVGGKRGKSCCENGYTLSHKRYNPRSVKAPGKLASDSLEARTSSRGTAKNRPKRVSRRLGNIGSRGTQRYIWVASGVRTSTWVRSQDG